MPYSPAVQGKCNIESKRLETRRLGGYYSKRNLRDLHRLSSTVSEI
jgi:hypothetical protein